jgi:predicted ribosomally synthesized peptide with SipW-like signal peptide
MDNKLLVSLMSIGLVATVVGMGTFAYFSDTETSTGNTVTAGVLDLSINTPAFNLVDLKPSYNLQTSNIQLRFVENPGKVYKKITSVVCAPKVGAVDPRDKYCANPGNWPILQAYLAQLGSTYTVTDATTCKAAPMMDAMWFDLTLGETVVIADRGVGLNGLMGKWIYLGYYAPVPHVSDGTYAEVNLKQSFHLMDGVDNWAQGQTCTFNEEYLLLQNNAPAPQGCVNPAGLQGQDNHIGGTTCPDAL